MVLVRRSGVIPEFRVSEISGIQNPVEEPLVAVRSGQDGSHG
jgi:hypothetical protein